MACVTKHRGRWVVDYRDSLGIRHKEVCDTRKEAKLLLAERVREIDDGSYQAPREGKTFAEVVEAYRKAHVEVNVRPSTRKDYEQLIELHLFPYLRDVKVRAITRGTAEAWRNKLLEKGVGRRTCNKTHVQFGAIMRYAVESRWVKFNPALEVKKLREERETDGGPLEDNILTPAEVRSLLKHATDRWRPLLRMAIYTGLRQGELLGLQWGDIDIASRHVHVRQQFSKGRFSTPKTQGSRRRVPLSEELLAELKAWKLRCPKGELELVFPHDSGEPLNHGILLRSGFYPALRRAKLRQIRFHDLRHCFASLLIAANVHPKSIQALMGHSTIRITMDTYGRLMRGHDDGAAEKLAALIAGSGNIAGTSEAPAEGKTQKPFEKLEAGVGIEPAYTALQAVESTNQQQRTTGDSKHIKGLQRGQHSAIMRFIVAVVPNLSHSSTLPLSSRLPGKKLDDTIGWA